MNKDELKEKLQGEWWDTASSARIPKDSISLDQLVEVLMPLLGHQPGTEEKTFDGVSQLKVGVVMTGNGRYMKDGRFISKAEATQ